MAIKVSCGADTVLSYSAGTQSVALSATATGSPTAYQWTLRGVPYGSSALTGSNGSFVNGITTVQNPSFIAEAGIEGTYVFECVASNSTESSDPGEDLSSAQQLIVVKTQTGLAMPGDWQYDWASVQNDFWTGIAYPETLSEYNAILGDANLDEATDARPLADHGIGSATHTPTVTLAEFNLLISDADLDDESAPRGVGGAAGGDLSGTYPNPTVEKLGGVTVDCTGVADTNVLTYNGSSWVPAAVPTQSFLSLTDTPSSLTGMANKLLGVNTAEDATIFVSLAETKMNWPILETADSDLTLITAYNQPGTSSILRLTLSDDAVYEATSPLTVNTGTNGLGGMSQDGAGPTYETLADGLWHLYAVPDTVAGGNAFDLVLSQGSPLAGGPTGGIHASYKYLTTVRVSAPLLIYTFKQVDQWCHNYEGWGLLMSANPVVAAADTWYPFDGTTLGGGGSAVNDIADWIPPWCSEIDLNVRAQMTTTNDICHISIWGGNPPQFNHTGDSFINPVIAVQGYGTNDDEKRHINIRIPVVDNMISVHFNRSAGLTDLYMAIYMNGWHNSMYGV